jgi:hypothetical protein
MKQTAVEWLADFFESGVTSCAEWTQAKEQAKAMEKEQIIKANRDGVDMVVDKKDFILGEKYYNETFKSE